MKTAPALPNYTFAAVLVLVILGMSTPAAHAQTTIDVGKRDLQEVIDAAAPHAVVRCDRNRQVTIAKTVVIEKPLTLTGLNARLPDGLGKTPIVEVFAEGVTVADFVLRGNADTVLQTDRCALLRIHAGDFRVERGVFENSSKDGVEIDPIPERGRIEGGVVRDIVGRGVVRDVVSISGSTGEESRAVTHVLVENIRGYDSELRGTVEVSDGTDHITVRKVYAENCVYAVDVQDHNKEGQINRNVLIEDVYAVRCRHALRTANRPFGHANLTLRTITAEECEQSLQVSNTDRVTVDDVRIIGNTGPCAVKLDNCRGLSIRNVSLVGGAPDSTGLVIQNCNDVVIDGVSVSGEPDLLVAGVRYRISKGSRFSNLCIRNVSAKYVREAGIVLENDSKKGTLQDYIISGNIARVEDRIAGKGALIFGNLPQNE